MATRANSFSLQFIDAPIGALCRIASDAGTGNEGACNLDPLVTDRTIELDKHRGMSAQKATELRRLVSEVAADRAKLKARQDELEKFLVAAPAANWAEAAEKARYLLSLFAATMEAQDPRRKTLIANLLDDFERLLALPGHPGADAAPPKQGT